MTMNSVRCLWLADAGIARATSKPHRFVMNLKSVTLAPGS
jgi:hypothetical protein